MRIIKEGNPKEKIQAIEVTCNHCGHVFAYLPMDPFLAASFGGSPKCDLYCPYCGHYVALKEESEVKDGN